MKFVAQSMIVIGILAVVFGVLNAGLMYRDLRIQRLLHETVVVMNLDLGYRSNWKTASTPLYEPGNYVLYLIVSDTIHSPSADTVLAQQMPYGGTFIVDVEDQSGATVLHHSLSGTLNGRVSPQRTMWIPIDTLRVPKGGQEWKTQSHVVDSDARFAGVSAQLILTPPQASDFGTYLQEESPKLFLMGVLIILGFTMTIVGGYLHKRTA